MYRKIDPDQIRVVADSLTRTGVSVRSLVNRIRVLPIDDRCLASAVASIPWWQSTELDLRRQLCEIDPGPQRSTGPEWHQGPPRADQLGTPSRAASFFSGLSPLQATVLARRYPEVIGPADGVPVELRYLANKLLARRFLEQLRARRRELVQSGLGFRRWPEDRAGWLRRFYQPLFGYREALEEQLADLDRYIANAERWARDDRRFLTFDPAGDGLIVEVMGVLETARHVAVVVPGVGSDLSNYEERLRTNAQTLYDSTKRPDTTVIAWLGYDAPDDLLAAADPRRAEQAAGTLSHLFAGLSIRNEFHATLIGHSYGSVVAGAAVQAGTRVDEIVFVGSPGVGANHVSDLGLPPNARVWAGRSESDPIRWARDIECLRSTHICYPSPDRLFFGPDPTKPAFGAIPFTVADAPPFDAHSAYFERDSASLNNLTHIMLGQDHLVTGPDDVLPTFSE